LHFDRGLNTRINLQCIFARLDIKE
jgi:hypothetical protein